MKSVRFIVSCSIVGILGVGILGIAAYAQSGRRPVYQPPAPTSPTTTVPAGPGSIQPNANGTCPKVVFPGEYSLDGLSQKPTTPTQSVPSSSDPDAEEVLKIDTTLVSIPATVLDRSGRFVPYLTKCDFHIYEDGVLQEVSEFSAVETPFHVVLLLDTSNSTRFRMDEIHSAALAFINQLRSQDQVMVVSFDSNIQTHCEFTSNRDVLRRAIYETRTGGGTKLYDAVDWVVNERLSRIQGRKAIVLFTDGVDTSSRRASARSNIELVEESDVLVYPIQYDTMDTMYPGSSSPNGGRIPDIWGNGGGWPQPRGRRRWPLQTPMISMMAPPQIVIGRGGQGDYQSASVYLEDIATHSGGRRQQADSMINLSSAFSRIAEELRHQYSLGYYPTNTAKDGTFRRIKIRISQANAVVRAKEGYKAPGGTAANANRPGLKRRNFDPQ